MTSTTQWGGGGGGGGRGERRPPSLKGGPKTTKVIKFSWPLYNYDVIAIPVKILPPGPVQHLGGPATTYFSNLVKPNTAYLVYLRVRVVIFASIIKHENKVLERFFEWTVLLSMKFPRDFRHVNGPLDQRVVIWIILAKYVTVLF